MVRGLLRPDLFTVVHEQFFTDTTDYADIVLPATTFFEHKDVQKAYGHYYLQVSNQAIAPLGECRSNVEVFRALALRMGFEEACFRESVDEMIDLALDSKEPWMRGNKPRATGAGAGAAKLQWSRLRADQGFQKHHAMPEQFLPFAQGGFRTPSGKAELYSEAVKALGLDPVAEFKPPTESRHGTKEKDLPLELLARKSDNFLNSTFSNLPSVHQMEETGLLEISWRRRKGARHFRWRPGTRFQRRGDILLKARVERQGAGR